MKLFSQRIQESVCADVNPGNGINRLGVTNHYTPIDNIISNVRNLFACHMGIVVDKGEDEVSLKLHCMKFINKDEISKILYNNEIMNGTCLATYIQQQGLTQIKMINVGQYWIVYFCPIDIAQAVVPSPQAGETAPEVTAKCASYDNYGYCECNELKTSQIVEAEMDTINESGEDEEMEDITKNKLKEVLSMKDRVKAAKQLELMVSQEMELPREYYFAGVKSNNGDESIALRWKYEKRAGKNKTVEIIKTLINIYDDSDDGVFVPDYDEESIVELPEEVKKLIDNVLEFIGAEKTKDPAVYSLSGKKLDDSDKDDKNDNNKDEESKDNSKEDNSEEKSDDLLDDKKDKKKDNKSDDSDDLLG